MKGKWTLGLIIKLIIELVVIIVQIAWLIFLIGLFIYNWKLGSIVGIIWVFLDWMRKPIEFKIVRDDKK